MRTTLVLLLLAAACLAGTAQAGDASPLADALATFEEWFPGEYDNHEQVWQEEIDKAPSPHERLHHIFLPVTVPALGTHVYYVEQYLNGDPEQVYRQRLYQVEPDDTRGALRLTIWSFRDEARYRHAWRDPSILAALAPADLTTTPGCEVWWRFDGVANQFTGTMPERACSVEARATGERIYITDDLRLTPGEIWIRDEAFAADGRRVFGREDGVHHKNRKVQYYTGWAAVKKPAPDKDGEWWFMSGAVVHNEGQIVPIVDGSGARTGYSFQLALLTYQNTRVPILKLGLIDDRSGDTITYSWADTGAGRIGINTRQIQVGLTLKPGAPSFGFDLPAQPAAPNSSSSTMLPSGSRP